MKKTTLYLAILRTINDVIHTRELAGDFPYETLVLLDEVLSGEAGLPHAVSLGMAPGDKPVRGVRNLAEPAPQSSAWRQPPGLDVLWGRLDTRGREAIRMIAMSDVSIEELRAGLKLPSTKHVSHVLAAIKRVAASVGIHDWRDVFTYTISGARGERVSLYHAGPLLRGEGR